MQCAGVPALVLLVAGWLAGALLAAALHAHARGGAAALPASIAWTVALGTLGLVLGLLRRVRRALAAGGPGAWRESARGDASLRAVAMGAFAVAGLLAGDAAWRRQARCTHALATSAHPLLVRVDTDVSPGAWGRGSARSMRMPRGAVARATAGCRVPVTLTVESGRAPAGAWVRVQAARWPVARGLRLDAATVEPTGAVDALHAWRARAGTRIDARFGANAPLVRALLVADQDGIAHDVRDRYADAGLVHLLSVSGLHVAIIAGALRTLGAALRLRRSVADLVAVLGVVAYVLLLGWPAPAVRAATMLFVVTLSARLGRPVHPWTALALGVTLPTVQQTVVADLGWQLSAAGMAALVGARGVMRRWRMLPLQRPAVATPLDATLWRLRCAGPRLRGWRRAIVQELLVGLVASAVSAPLVAWVFGRVSLVAPFTNVLAAPAVSLLQPTLFLALLLDLAAQAGGGHVLGMAAQWTADASRAPIAALDLVATLGGRVPLAAVAVAPGFVTACCMGVLAGAFVVATARRRPLPPLLCGGAALVFALWWPVLSRGPGRLELHVLDVGQGDALALRTPRGRWILIDAGRVWRGGDAGRRVVVPWVRRRGGDVALFVLTHPDADHVGGASSVLAALRPAAWWDPGFVHGSAAYRDALQQAVAHGIPWRRARLGDSLRVDGVLLRVLGPDSAWTAQQQSGNDASTVLLVQHGRVRMLLTGDAEVAEERWLLERWGAGLGATVLKVGHHGSRTSSSSAFLDAVRPRLAIISVGADNRYGHPAPDVVAALRARGADVLRTDRDGAVILRSDGRRVAIETARARWSLDVP